MLRGAVGFAQKFRKRHWWRRLRVSDRLMFLLIGLGVIFASLGLGEAVYKFLFRDFDGATDRLPIELMFGVAFAWTATKLVRSG